MAATTSSNTGGGRTSLVWLVLLRVPELVLGALIAVLVVFLTLSVVARYAFDIGFTWSDEAARLLFIWVVFVGFAVGLRHRANIGMEFLVDRLPQSWRRAAAVLQDLMIFGFSLVFTWQSVVTVRFSFLQRLPALQITIAWLYFAVLVAGVLMTIYAAVNLWETVRGKSVPHADAVGEGAMEHSE